MLLTRWLLPDLLAYHIITKECVCVRPIMPAPAHTPHHTFAFVVLSVLFINLVHLETSKDGLVEPQGTGHTNKSRH